MAKNILSQNDYSAIIDRINQLTVQSPRAWGKMSIDQMLQHCSIQLKIGVGLIPETEREGSALYRTTFGRWLLLYAIPWPKGAKTPTEMNVTVKGMETSDFQHSKQELLKLLESVQALTRFSPHPFFGDMKSKDWGRLIWKHLDHHLRQFST